MDAHDGLLFVPLGGAGEIGLNVYLYGIDGKWLMVDLGISFADESLPGVDIVLPDLSFIEERRDDLLGIVLTHVHEDHFGAIPYLWSRLGCPVHCTRFAASLLRRKLAEFSLDERIPVQIHEPGERFDVGPFNCTYIHVTHSILEANALAIRTKLGNILHSGDWKLDSEPLVGKATDVEALEAFGEEGVLAFIGDSTNVLTPGTSGSEAEVRTSLMELVARQPNRVALTTFASNVARMATAIEVGKACGREVVLVGRSMRRMFQVAQEVGYLRDVAPLIDERSAGDLPRDKVLYLCTGSQGESRAALARIAGGSHPSVKLERGDTAIFSSKIIPGNERTLYNLHNLLVLEGIEVITEQDHFVHVSGHPCRDEMEQMYRWIKPEICVPVHGEARHLHGHVQLADELGVPQTVQVENGDLVRLGPGEAAIVDHVDTGRLVVDNGEIVQAQDDVFRMRRRLMHHGTVLVGLVLDGFGSIMAPPQISVVGATDIERAPRRRDRIVDSIVEAIEVLNDDSVGDDEKVRQAVRTVVRRGLNFSRDRRPIIEVQITRLTGDMLQSLESEAHV